VLQFLVGGVDSEQEDTPDGNGRYAELAAPGAPDHAPLIHVLQPRLDQHRQEHRLLVTVVVLAVDMCGGNGCFVPNTSHFNDFIPTHSDSHQKL